MARIYGVEPAAVLGDVKRWAALIALEDRDLALDHLERARRGDAVMHEFRTARAVDGAFRWVRDTDFPLLDERGRVQRIGGLSQIYGFMRQSGGPVQIETAAGKGTTVRLSLSFHETNPRARSVSPTRGKTLLLLDDERDLRRMLADQLRDIGYRVLESDRRTRPRGC